MTSGPHTVRPPERPAATPYGPSTARPTDTDRESMRYYLSVFRVRRRMMVAFPLVLSLFALGVNLVRARTYAAHAAFLASEPQSMSGSLGALSSIASQLGIPALSAVAASSASLSSQFYGDLLTSNALVHDIVTTRYDANGAAENGGKPFSGTLVEYFESDGTTATDRELAAMRSFRSRLIEVRVDRTTGIVSFDVRTTNRRLSALVSRRILDLVNEFNLRRRQTQAAAEREFDAKRAHAALDTLHVAEAALAAFRTTNIDFSRSPLLATRESEFQRRVTLAQQIYVTVAQRYELANIEAVRNTPVITVLDAPEGMVEALPRYTRQFTLIAFVIGVVIAAVVALLGERRRV